MRTRFGADFRKRLKTANAAVEEASRLRIQLTTQFAETVQCEHFFGINMQAMRFQQCCQRLGICRIKAHMHVIDTETELIAQHAGRTNVSGDHRFFDNTVSNTAWFSDDIQHFTFFTENKTVIRAIFKHQRMVITPFAATLANLR